MNKLYEAVDNTENFVTDESSNGKTTREMYDYWANKLKEEGLAKYEEVYTKYWEIKKNEDSLYSKESEELYDELMAIESEYKLRPLYSNLLTDIVTKVQDKFKNKYLY